jgi:hypothetical protein
LRRLASRLKTRLPIDFTRAYARSGKTLAVVATRDNAEPFDPDGRFYRYDCDDLPAQDWTYSDFGFRERELAVVRHQYQIRQDPFDGLPQQVLLCLTRVEDCHLSLLLSLVEYLEYFSNLKMV